MLLDLLKTILLGIIEGLTEFLPVSSTGHLIVASSLLNFPAGAALRVTFDIFIQLGAILAVVWYYRRELVGLAITAPSQAGPRRFLLAVLVAFLPVAVLGLVFKDFIESKLFGPAPVAYALIAGGIVILLAETSLSRRGHRTDLSEITLPMALLICLAQCFALIPGVSRSLASIFGGMIAGLDRKTATVFSFYLAIPTLGVATVYSLVKSLRQLQAGDLVYLAVGLVVSFFVALWVIDRFLRFVQHNTFRGFAFYRIAVGIVILILIGAGILSATAGS